MSVSEWVQLGVAALSGSALPWLLKTAMRLARGDVDRADRRADAENSREAAELERLMRQISGLTARHGDLEDLVDLLRRELDRALVRGNATLTMARILLFAVDQEPHPSVAMIAARGQAQAVINGADDQIKRGN